MTPVGPSPPGAPGSATDWRVVIDEKGRCGSISYNEPAGSVGFSWEFGGGDTVAIISFEDEATWRTRYPWAVGRRAEILRRVADEVIRQKSPGSFAEIDEQAGWINLRQVTPPRLPAAAPASHQAFRDRKAKLTLILAAFVLVLVVAAFGLKSMFSIQSSTGTPLGLSVRTPQHIATLIRTLEPYVPSLHRNPDNDRHRLALFLYPVDGRSPGRTIPIAQGLRIGDFNLAQLLGCDGSTVWFNLNGIGGVNLTTGKLVGAADLRRANTVLDETWDDFRRFEFDGRLRVTLPDRQRIFEVVPETLQAIPSPTPRDPAKLPFDPALQDFLSSGVRPTPTEWLGLHSPNEVAREFKPKSRLSRTNRAENAKELRRLHRAELGPELDRGYREVLSMTPVSEDEFFNAAFLRAAASADPLRLSAPESFLMVYTSKPGLGGTAMLARVDSTGKILWRTDTGIERFKLAQILPDARNVAFIGTRPPVPDKLSEPILVIVDNPSGAVSTTTLWK
ncbi:MAG: hypothetical protein ABIZ81_02415 [Opitutaceae bacterium]